MTVKISNLPAATSVGSGDVLPVVQSGTTKKIDLNSPWSINIDGGNIDGTAIGASSASSGAFTTLDASGDVNFDSGTLFVDASADAVGIGTTSPNAWASGRPAIEFGGSVQPAIAFNGTSTNGGAIWTNSYFDGQNKYVIDGHASRFDTGGGAFKFNISSSGLAGNIVTFQEAMRITSSGNVGIGTTSPTALLHLSGDTAQLNIEDNGSYSADSVSSRIQFNGRDAAGVIRDLVKIEASQHAGGSGTGSLDFVTRISGSVASRMRIDSSGRVGIGTTAPAAALNVVNPTEVNNRRVYAALGTTATVSDPEADVVYGSGIGEVVLKEGAANRPAVLSIGGNVNAGDTLGAISFFRSSNTNGYRNIAGIDAVSTTSGTADRHGGHIIFRTKPDGSTSLGNTERMRIDSSGHAIIPAGVTLGTSAGVYNAANTLDDYEEGTFTPVIVGLSTAGTGTYSVQNGKYTKIGNTVYFLVEFVWSNHTGTGDMQINGLPFTSSANVFPLMIRPDNFTLSSNSYPIFSVPASSNYVQMAQTTTGTVSGALIPMDTAASLRVSGFYFV